MTLKLQEIVSKKHRRAFFIWLGEREIIIDVKVKSPLALAAVMQYNRLHWNGLVPFPHQAQHNFLRPVYGEPFWLAFLCGMGYNLDKKDKWVYNEKSD